MIDCEKPHKVSSQCPLDILYIITGTFALFVFVSYLFLLIYRSFKTRRKTVLILSNDTETNRKIINKKNEYNPPFPLPYLPAYSEISHTS